MKGITYKCDKCGYAIDITTIDTSYDYCSKPYYCPQCNVPYLVNTLKRLNEKLLLNISKYIDNERN